MSTRLFIIVLVLEYDYRGSIQKFRSHSISPKHHLADQFAIYFASYNAKHKLSWFYLSIEADQTE